MFQRAFEIILALVKWNNALYIEYSIIYSPLFTVHIQQVQNLLHSLQSAFLSLKLKCVLLDTLRIYLGDGTNSERLGVERRCFVVIERAKPPMTWT